MKPFNHLFYTITLMISWTTTNIADPSVVDEDHCSYTLNGTLHTPIGGDYIDTDSISVSLSKTTVVQIKTLGSEMDTFLDIKQHFNNESDQSTDILNQDNCGGSNGDQNEDLNIELSAGEYTIVVGACESEHDGAFRLEVSLYHCDSSNESASWTAVVFAGVGIIFFCFVCAILTCCFYDNREEVQSIPSSEEMESTHLSDVELAPSHIQLNQTL